ncbi:MAG: cupin domain-containing protein [Ruminococcaceae bacterium]|nr:cupin domain-containing protein [Oscillospiraceae bacterium]
MGTTGLDIRIMEMANRIKELRDIVGLTVKEMAAKTGVSYDEYLACEAGERDLNFAFLYRCALALKVDVTDIVEGSSPRLAGYTVTRNGDGQKIEQAHGMVYYNLASAFKNRIAEPLYVVATYSKEAENADIELTSHEGQECDIIIKGALKVQVGDHTEVLHEGDSIYFDSDKPHGMIAVEGEDCIFYAIVLNPAGEPISNLTHGGVKEFTAASKKPVKASERKRIYEDYIITEENEKGALQSIDFKNIDKFNFAFDVIDRMGEEQPDKTALMHIAKDGTERRFTFKDIKRASSQTANYLKSLGIKKGDRVMLILKRHYQFWFTIMALHKLGAIAIPATNQLKEHDITYRVNTAGVKAIVCTADDGVANEVDIAAEHCPSLETKIMVGGTRDGWRNFDEEYSLFSGKFERTEDTACGDDMMLMYFTSGTTGNPKIATHNFKYPFGHFITAKYWHCVNPDGLHFTISDTGWAKAAWGKIYGQWLCEAGMFVYDFDRFQASEILPMFAKYNITTFCAPPTMLRMLVKEDLSKYDLSSVEHMTTAGEALNPEVFRQFEQATGLKIMEGFGQTETTCALANLVGTKVRLGSMGKPVPLYDIHLLDADGKEAAIGEVGEICIKTADKVPCGLFCGYYKDEEKTKEVWHDGYYHTGDTAWCDEDGYFWYVGRVDDVIKSSGYRIGPFEIENVIMELPFVLECGVSAAPDEVRGQVVKASIVLTKGTAPSEELKKEVQTYVKNRTAPYKYPRIVVFRDELPKTTSGKIQRNKL